MFNDLFLQDVANDLMYVKNALAVVEESDTFGKILAIVLAICNFLSNKEVRLPKANPPPLPNKKKTRKQTSKTLNYYFCPLGTTNSLLLFFVLFFVLVVSVRGIPT